MARMPPTWGMKAASPQTSRKAMKRCRWKVSDGEKRKGFVMRALDVTYYDVTRCYFIGSLYIYYIYIYISCKYIYIHTYVYYMIYLTLFDIT